MKSCKSLLLSSSIILLVLSGCNKDDEKPSAMGRVPGLPGPEQVRHVDEAAGGGPAAVGAPDAGAPSSVAAGQFNSPNLIPGTAPSTDGPTSPSAASANGGLPGGIPAPPETKVLVGGNKLQVAGIAFTTPDDWKSVPPSSRLRQAQYEISGDGGTAEGVVFYFGPGQGGGIEDNVRRWAGQFSSDDPSTSTVPVEVGRITKEDLQIALVRASGTYDPGMMGMGGPAQEPKKNYGLFGVVVDGGPEGPVFVKITGPKPTMDARAKEFEAFAQSAKKSSFK